MCLVVVVVVQKYIVINSSMPMVCCRDDSTPEGEGGAKRMVSASSPPSPPPISLSSHSPHLHHHAHSPRHSYMHAHTTFTHSPDHPLISPPPLLYPTSPSHNLPGCQHSYDCPHSSTHSPPPLSPLCTLPWYPVLNVGVGVVRQ